MQIGRRIYYELNTGNVIVPLGPRQGDVVETTQDQDWQDYVALQPYQQSAVGVMDIPYGQDEQNFLTYPYHVDITQTPPVIAWDTTNPIGASLSDVQASKKTQLQNMYLQTLTAGFAATVGGISYTFGWTTKDESDMSALQKAIDKAFLAFPVTYADISGNPVTVADQATLDSIELTATKFAMAQHQQVLTLTGDANAATTVDAVNAIQWTPATY